LKEFIADVKNIPKEFIREIGLVFETETTANSQFAVMQMSM